MQDMGRASALRQLSSNCVTFTSSTSADIDSGPFCNIIIYYLLVIIIKCRDIYQNTYIESEENEKI